MSFNTRFGSGTVFEPRYLLLTDGESIEYDPAKKTNEMELIFHENNLEGVVVYTDRAWLTHKFYPLSVIKSIGMGEKE